MRNASAWLLALAAAIPAAQAQADLPSSSAEPVRTYTLLREDENWSFLKDPSLRQDFWDPIKYIPLGPEGWFLTIGGEAREAFEAALSTLSAASRAAAASVPRPAFPQ